MQFLLLLLLNRADIYTILPFLVLIDPSKLGLALSMSDLLLELEFEARMADLGLTFLRQHTSLLKLETRLEMGRERSLEGHLGARLRPRSVRE